MIGLLAFASAGTVAGFVGYKMQTARQQYPYRAGKLFNRFNAFMNFV